MPNDEQRPERTGQILAPPFLRDVVLEINRLGKFARMTAVGLMLGEHLATLVAALQHEPALQDHPNLVNEAAELTEYAKAEAAEGNAYLNSVVAVRLVSILETAVTDAVVDGLRNRPDALKRPEFQRIKAPVAELLAASESDRAEYLASLLAQETRAALKPGIGKYEPLLDVVGLGGSVPDEVRRSLLELTEVRNVIVHRNGKVDGRFLALCPWLTATAGQRLEFSAVMLERYRAAAAYYVLELGQRWVRLTHPTMPSSAKMTATQETVLQQLRDTLKAG